MTRMVRMVLAQILLVILPVLVSAGTMPDTGQTKCYDNDIEIACPQPGKAFYGQDAQYTGPTRSYTKLGQNGSPLPDSATPGGGWLMTRDSVTGLIWEVKQNKDEIKNYSSPCDADNDYTWYDSNPATNGGDAGTPGDGTDTEDFINALNTTGFGGYTDWRLPTVKELSSLVNSSIAYPGPTIDTPWFPNTISSYYWSSTASAGNSSLALSVYFSTRNVASPKKSYSYNVRAVRAGAMAEPTLVDNGNGTVTDTETGLMWQKATAPGTYTWQQALAYAEGLVLPPGGYSDWRLPNCNELQTLVDYSQYSPSIGSLLQASTVSSYYWSSTTNAWYSSRAWLVSFNNGSVVYLDKPLSYYVRAVRTTHLAMPWIPLLLLDD